MMSRYFLKIKLFLVFIVLVSSLNAKEEAYIIANINVPTSEISKEDVSYIFLGKKHFWGNDTRIQTAYVLDKGEFSFIFFNAYVEKTYKKFKRYWLKKIFAGYGAAPKSFKDSTSVIDFVSKHEGAIGFYIGKKPINTENVKIIKVDGSEFIK